MTDRSRQYAQVHNLLLFQRHLALRESASPLTLILDTLEQPAKPLIRRYIDNAKLTKTAIVFISYDTVAQPKGITIYVNSRRKDAHILQREVAEAVSSSPERTLIIIDNLHALLARPDFNVTTFLFSLLRPPNPQAHPPTPSTAQPSTSSTSPSLQHPTLLALLHTDIPLPPPVNPYAPSPLTLLSSIATTVFVLHRPAQLLAKRRAAEKAQPEPTFGLEEGREGILVGMAPRIGLEISSRADRESLNGMVVEATFRRRSGREVPEWFFLSAEKKAGEMGRETARVKGKKGDGDGVILLDDHPLFRPLANATLGASDERGVGDNGAGEEGQVATFDLGLTEKQRQDRDGVVLPYFDAQRGVAEGGRILYEMGVEDDFDEEEDEI